MRVLLVTHLYPPHHTAGVENYTRQLAAGLSSEHEVAVATTLKVISRPTGTLRQRSLDGVPVFEVINNHDFASYAETWEHARMGQAFREVLSRFAPDVVHFQHFMYWSVDMISAVRERGARSLLTLHDFWHLCARMGQLIDAQGEPCPGPSLDRCTPCMAGSPIGQSDAARRWIRRLIRIRAWTGLGLDDVLRRLQRWRSKSSRRSDLPEAAVDQREIETWRDRLRTRDASMRTVLREVDQVVTPSRALRRQFVEQGIEETLIRVVPQGLDGEHFRRVERRAQSGTLRIAFIGTIAPHKGVDTLLRAALRLKGEWTLTVFGSLESHPEFAARCQEVAAGESRIRFAGRVDREQLVRAYGEVDVTCVPSLWPECCPLTIQESFLAGVPSVVSDFGGMAELVADGVSGLQASPGDADSWTAALQRLIDEPELLPHLRDGIPSVPSVAEHVSNLVELYAGVRSA